MKPILFVGVVALAATLAGCTGSPPPPAPAPTVTVTATPAPAPTVTVTATPAPAPAPTPPQPAVGDELTALNVWDVCFAHTTAQVDSDLTEWGRFSPNAVTQRGPGSFTVRISNVRNGAEAGATVTCIVEGRVGGVILMSWSRDAG
ncbi:MAG TPA: hypothetical protein VIQ26_01865 [Microbacteriaceae bacterium]